jgi:hypothetical protein
LLDAEGRRCSHCEDGAGNVGRNSTPEEESAAPSDPPFQFGLASLLLITTLGAVLMSVCVMLPGLGIILALLSAPALVQTYRVVRRRHTEGAVLPIQVKARLFLACLGIVTLVAVSATAAFLMSCAAGTMGVSLVTGGHGAAIGFALMIGFFAGLLAGGAILVLLSRSLFALLNRKASASGDRDRNRQDKGCPVLSQPTHLAPPDEGHLAERHEYSDGSADPKPSPSSQRLPEADP